MILTCPECATRYFVPDEKVSAGGRTVRCSKCGNRWTAFGQTDLDLFVDPVAGAEGRDQGDLPVSALPGEELPKVFRQKATNDRRAREAATAGVVWAGLAVGLVALGAAALVFRGSVVDLWPSTAGAYAAVGLDVNHVGLEIEETRAEAALQDGHTALVVSGVMRNVRDAAVTAPPLRISLRNKADKVVMVKLADPADPTIPPGETRYFAVSLLDPPTTAATAEVTFDLTKGAKGEKARGAPHGAAPAPAKVELRGLADPEPATVIEAEPVAEAAAPADHAPQDGH
jgi:predicted Zn finger-like uncharacterized protein